MEKRIIVPPDVHPTAAYAHAIRAGNTIYVAGQVALDPSGTLVGPGNVEAQAVQVFENLRRVLAAAGAALGDVVKMTTFATHFAFRPTISEVRARYGLTQVASTFVVVESLASPDLLVEIEVVAVVEG
ncbi:MAG: RidA family protein [Chloroflexi bacterium]|nr:RidA family protein [Chloroflexota bacterium]